MDPASLHGYAPAIGYFSGSSWRGSGVHHGNSHRIGLTGDDEATAVSRFSHALWFFRRGLLEGAGTNFTTPRLGRCLGISSRRDDLSDTLFRLSRTRRKRRRTRLNGPRSGAA